MAGKLSELTAAVSVADVDQVELLQGGTNKRATAAMIRANLVSESTVRTANTVLSGPTAGAAAAATFRALVAADIPSLSAVYLPIGGGTLTGALVLSGAPTLDLHAATKLYVDGIIAALNASNLTSGTVPDARFPATLPALNGSALTALNASNLGSGTIPDARFPAVLPAVSGANLTNLPGGISGLTAGVIPVATSGTAIGNSIITQTGVVSVEVTASDAAINTVSDALILRHATNDTAAAGFGTGLLWQGENAAGTMRDMAQVRAVYADAGTGVEDVDIKFYAAVGGSLAHVMTLSHDYGLSGLRGMVFPGSAFIEATEFRLVALGELALYSGAVRRWAMSYADGHLEPSASITYDVGSPTKLVRKIYAATSGVQTANGAESNVKTISESITLSTVGLTTDSTADLLPANSIILAVTARITTTITTTTDWALGDATTAARFAAANATLTAGTTAVGVAHQQGSVATDAAGPVQTAAAKLRITCSGANPGAGVVRVTVTYLELTPPTS